MVVFVLDALAFLEIDHGQREPGRCIKHGKHAVGEISRKRQVERVASRVVVRGKKATEHTDRSLRQRESMRRTRTNAE